MHISCLGSTMLALDVVFNMVPLSACNNHDLNSLCCRAWSVTFTTHQRHTHIAQVLLSFGGMLPHSYYFQTVFLCVLLSVFFRIFLFVLFSLMCPAPFRGLLSSSTSTGVAFHLPQPASSPFVYTFASPHIIGIPRRSSLIDVPHGYAARNRKERSGWRGKKP